MNMMQHILLSGKKNSLLSALAALCLVIFLAFPSKAFAICEFPGLAAASASGVQSAQTSQVNGITSALKSIYSTDVTSAETTLMNSLDTLETTLVGKLDWFWGKWHQALKDMTKQIHAGFVDESRQFSGNYDSSDLSTTVRQEQRAEFEAKKRFQPTNQACQFDTVAKYMSRSKKTSEALATGYSLDFNNVGNNDKNSAAAGGEPTLQKSRWQIYQSKFCDKDSNNGNSGCTTAPTAITNSHILPSKTIFAKETIDLSDPDTQDAVTQLMFNITGYTPPDLIVARSFKSSVGLQRRQENREYIAQMDAVGALAYSVVAERAPGEPAPQIKALRTKMGVTDASDKPSEREIRQAIIGQLWDPNYYKELYDSPSTITQKELYLKAYSVVMLYDMISKQEKISTAYAIETANMLDGINNSRHNASPSSPLK